MKALVAAVAIGAVLVGCGGAAPPARTTRVEPHATAPPPPPHELTPQQADIVARADRFLAAPLAASDDDVSAIAMFALQSHDVAIVIGDDAPWLDATDEAVRARLLAGYIAGDVRAQLRSGEKGERRDAALAGAVDVYRALKAQGVTVPSMERLLDAN